MLKKTLFVFLFFCLFVIFTPPASACDPLGCMLGGEDQDVLILGEITDKAEDVYETEVKFIFPQTKITSLDQGERLLTVGLENTMNYNPMEDEAFDKGKIYLMSLNFNGVSYSPAWGIHEITSSNFKDAKLIKKKYA